MDSKPMEALTAREAGNRLGLSFEAVKRRIGNELRGFRDPNSGWWMITVESIKRWEVEHAAEIAARSEAV